ncbi:MAG: type II 3-dehydroquinate dehydratase, partial [Proteobacteria bacterium]|nr:type II 3-dehydroquinate dehydratase [Pseudomonadota bacterium]
IATCQSNHEGAIIDAIQNARGKFNGIVLNGGAFTHYSYAIYDALVAVDLPTVEVHISNIMEREPWRRTSVTAPAAIAVVYGRGTAGYINAIDHLAAYIAMPPTTASYDSDSTPDTVIDLRTPRSPEPAPVAMLVHGGFWRDQWTRDLMSPLATSLTGHGWATANVEYTRGEDSLETAIGNIAKATTWLRAHGADHGIDGSRIVLIGHSAGGFLAIRSAHEDPGLLGVVALAPVTDLAAISATGPEDDPVASALGSHTTVPTLDGEPLRPVHIIHGGRDTSVPDTQSTTYAAQHPETVVQHAAGDIEHMAVIDPHDVSFGTLLEALRQLNLN